MNKFMFFLKDETSDICEQKPKFKYEGDQEAEKKYILFLHTRYQS